jgi:hypothetical protein
MHVTSKIGYMRDEGSLIYDTISYSAWTTGYDSRLGQGIFPITTESGLAVWLTRFPIQ